MKLPIIAKKILDKVPRMPWSTDHYRVVTNGLVDNYVATAHVDERVELTKLFFSRDGMVVDKWLQYLPVYDRYLSPYRGTPVRMLEIGVNKGGSLDLWREYLGPDAVIFGIDINPDCANHVEAPNQVRIGSQDDPEFLKRTIEEMGGVDIVLDDGSHIVEHQCASFETLFPLLDTGGVYIIEDLHTSYWPRVFHGGYRRSDSAIEMLKSTIDDMHKWYHDRKPRTATGGHLSAVHFYDSIAVVEKCQASPPLRTLSGNREEVARLLNENYRG